MTAAPATVGLLHYPRGEDGGVGRTRSRTPRRAYVSGIAYRANARPPDYMARLLAERHPEATMVRTSQAGWEGRVAGCARLILLYPDATGLGWTPLERRLARIADAPLSALNGRRREFTLDRTTFRQLRVRRALERSMAGEIAVLALLGLLTLPLVAWDLLKGRR